METVKRVLLAVCLMLSTLVFAPVASAEDSVIVTALGSTGNTISLFRMCYVEVWGYDKTHNIITPLKWEHYSVEEMPGNMRVFVPSNGGVWEITVTIMEDTNNWGSGGPYVGAVTSITHNATTSAAEIDLNYQDYANGAAMQLMWENGATVSKTDKTQTLRVDIPSMDRYSLSYRTTSGSGYSNSIICSTTNIPLGVGPYTTVTVTAKKGDTEIGKKSIGIFVQ